MNVLVVVASKHGSTQEIAEVVAQELALAGHAAEVKGAEDAVSVDPYDAVVLGSAIYAGSWLPEAKRFAEGHRAALAQRPVWVFSSGPLGEGEPQPQDDPERLAAPLGETPVRDHRVFAGRLERQGLGLGERLIARVVGAPEGDFRDWEAVRSWAREIATALRAAPRS